MGDPVHFDQNGDPPASYDIINWHVTPQGGVEFATVGHFVSSDGSGGQFHLEIERVMWGAGSGREVRFKKKNEKLCAKMKQYYAVIQVVFCQLKYLEEVTVELKGYDVTWFCKSNDSVW